MTKSTDPNEALDFNAESLVSRTAKPEVYVWNVIYYTEDEEGNLTYYEAPKADHSMIAESVELEDLAEISPNCITAYEIAEKERGVLA